MLGYKPSIVIRHPNKACRRLYGHKGQDGKIMTDFNEPIFPIYPPFKKKTQRRKKGRL